MALGGTGQVARTRGRGRAHDATGESGGSRIFCATPKEGTPELEFRRDIDFRLRRAYGYCRA